MGSLQDLGPGIHALYDPLSFGVGGTCEKGQMPLPLLASFIWQRRKGFADIQKVPISGFGLTKREEPWVSLT